MAIKKQKLLASDFVHLHNHTQYSLLDGLTKIPALIDQIKALGMEAVAMTDHGTLSGAIEFYKTAHSQSVKPIIGMEAYMAARGHTDKDSALDKQYFHLIILAMNNQGYQNLMRLSTIANLEGFYYKPRVDRELLEQYNEGLIILSGCINGEVSDALRQGQYAQAKQHAQWYKQVFGDRYYMEIQDHGHPDHPTFWQEQQTVNDQALKLAKELDIPAVITGDAHYLHREDQEAHEILLCVQTGSFLSDDKRMSLKQFELHVADPNEVITRWGTSHPEAISNTKAIADRCQVEISLGNILIPKFPLPKVQTEKSYLDTLVYQGLAWRYGGVSAEKVESLNVAAAKKELPEAVLERATYELGVIERMNFNGFFLIVADFIGYGKSRDIVFGPGRGSAASSIVAYALKITELDPLQYDLMFERFLNPDRISMPDFDIDIQDSRRDEVIEYCVQKYGEDRVANIVTFGRMAARNAVRDVARVLQVPYGESDRLAKMIPQPIQGRHIPLATSLKENADLKREYETSAQAKTVFDLAVKLEGTIRSHGVHAAGVVIAPEEIVAFAPLERAQKGVIATQYAMGPIEELGLLKIDFLGLSNLTIIKNALHIIKQSYGKEIDIDNLPLDDKKTFQLLARGDTTGVFQLESAGMKRFWKELKPNQFADIIAMVALYRPGPMAEFPRFIAGKNNPSTITYPHPTLEPILKSTYGVMVFQEQIINLLQLLAGYSPGEADLVRKAIGKKKRDIMESEHPRFIAGCEKKGLSNREAEKIWNLIQPFADYSFNKAHAACYALISYQTAYLKANYPAAFMAALMTSDYDDTDRLAIEITECRAMGIEVLAPDVSESLMDFTVITGDDGKERIRFGMNAIKNVGSGAVEEILRARGVEEGFASLEDFLAKTNPRIVNRKALESLVKAGALDGFAERSLLANNIDTLLAYANRVQKDQASGQTDLFGGQEVDSVLTMKLALKAAEVEFTAAEQLVWERELLGLYLSRHPLEDYRLLLSEQCSPIAELSVTMDGRGVQLGGSVTEAREITTKNGQKMAFVKLADLSGELELVLFPGVYQQTTGLWERDKILLVNGKISNKGRDGGEGELKILVDDARELTAQQAKAYEATGKKPKIPKPKKEIKQKSEVKTNPIARPVESRVYIRVQTSADQKGLMRLKQELDNFPGLTPVVLIVGPEPTKQVIKLPTAVDPSSELITALAEIFGPESVKYQ